MRRRGFRTRLGALLLAAALLPAAGCYHPETPPVAAGEADWGEHPRSDETLPPYSQVPTRTAPAGSGTTTATASHTTWTQGTGTESTGTEETGSRTTSAATTGGTTGTTTGPTAAKPSIDGELRGAWVSFYEVEALLSGKTPEEARAAIDGVMENCVSYGLNAVFFHVRANSDAYYPSKIFKPAKKVEALLQTGFDPLAYAVEAAHKRGLQLHAWINPYRIGRDVSYAVGDNSQGDRWFSKYSNGNYDTLSYYYIPTSVDAQKTILDGVREVLTYDVDGVHFDDYFYPGDSDPKVGINHKTPETFESGYKDNGGMTLGDWRRAAVDALVSQCWRLVHQKEGCVFGVSPAHDMERIKTTQYADTGKWLANRGYIDYLCPQIYFGFEHQTAAFDVCTQKWLNAPRASSVKLYIGLALYKAGIDDDTYAGESGRTEWKDHGDIMKRQVEYLRAQSGIGGMIFYRYDWFENPIAKTEVENLLPLLKQ